MLHELSFLHLSSFVLLAPLTEPKPKVLGHFVSERTIWTGPIKPDSSSGESAL